MKDPLIIIPCGKRKVWASEPGRGPTKAREAYTGGPFRKNMSFAERFAGRWLILSARYGLIDPDFVIPGDYDTTFKRPDDNTVAVETLVRQIAELGLDGFEVVIGLGGEEYRTALTLAFEEYGRDPAFPFAGLPCGLMMQAIKRRVEAGPPPCPVCAGGLALTAAESSRRAGAVVWKCPDDDCYISDVPIEFEFDFDFSVFDLPVTDGTHFTGLTLRSVYEYVVRQEHPYIVGADEEAAEESAEQEMKTPKYAEAVRILRENNLTSD